MRLGPPRSPPLYSSAASDVYKRQMFNVVLVMVMGIGIAIIFTMMSITMLERKQEIATRLTLGSRPWAVGRSFLIETTAIALGILPVGIVLGWALCWVLINKVLS